MIMATHFTRATVSKGVRAQERQCRTEYFLASCFRYGHANLLVSSWFRGGDNRPFGRFGFRFSVSSFSSSPWPWRFLFPFWPPMGRVPLICKSDFVLNFGVCVVFSSSWGSASVSRHWFKRVLREIVSSYLSDRKFHIRDITTRCVRHTCWFPFDWIFARTPS